MPAKTGMSLGFAHASATAEMIYEARRVISPRAKTARLAVAQLDGNHVADFIEDTIDLMKYGSMECKEWAAEALHTVAETAQENAHKLGVRGLKPLIGLADEGSHAAQAHAAAAVALIIQSDPEYVSKVCKHGGIGLLTRVLRAGTGSVQEQAAAALASIASVTEQVEPVVRSGAVPLLVSLLHSTNSRAAARAADAIGNLAATPEGQQSAYKAGAIKFLLRLLDSGSLGAQECAARALAALAQEHLAIQTEICKLGGIKILVATLSAINTEVQTQAACVLSQLCISLSTKHRKRTQDAITKAGGVGPLLAVIDMPRARQPLVAQATHTLAMLARGNSANQEVIALHHGLRPLVEQLLPSRPDGESNTPLTQANAALALTWMCRHNLANQSAVADLGGLAQLCGLLKRGSPNFIVEAEAAGALWALTECNAMNKAAVASSGAIVALCELLDAKSERAQTLAAKALSALAMGNEPNQLAAVSLLVAGLVRTAERAAEADHDDLRERLIKTLWRLVRDNGDSQLNIARAGGADNLVQLLRDQTDSVSTFALWALSLALDESFCAVVTERDGITPLVRTLASPSLEAIEQATAALAKLSLHGGDVVRHGIAAAGGIAPLIALLDGREVNSSAKAQQDAAAALAELALLPRNKVSIEQSGGIAPLCELLCTFAVVLPEHTLEEASALRRVANNSKRFAAAALARLAVDVSQSKTGRKGEKASEKAEAKAKALAAQTADAPGIGAEGSRVSLAEQIALAGAVQPLVNMLSGDAGLEAQEEAAGALCELAAYEKNRIAITESGAIGPLVSLLACDRSKARERAEAALVRLSIEDANRVLIIEQLVGMLMIGPSPYSSAAEKKAADAARRDDAVKARSALQDSKHALEEAKYAVAEADKKATDAEKKAAELQMRRALADVEKRAATEATAARAAQEATRRAADEEKAQEQAAAALVNLASDSEDNRVTIVNAGGIPALLSLLSGESSNAKEATLRSIIAMSKDSKSRQDAIARAGGINLLVQALQSGASKSDATAAIQCSLAAEAVWRLAKNHTRNKVAIAEAGAIPPLVTMLGSPQPEMCTNAAGALSCLSRENTRNQTAVARTGAIAPLCTILREGTPEAREQAASAIWALAQDNMPNKSVLAKFGAIEPLVGLLVTGDTPKSARNSIGALTSLASMHADNRAIVSKRVVGLLNTKDSERGLRALGAIASLCSAPAGSEVSFRSEALNASQLAVAKQGGVPLVVSWLSSTSEAAKAEAAHALLALSADNVTIQALVVASGAIQPLTSIISRSGSAKAQEHAAMTLWHLGSSPENQLAIAEAGGILPVRRIPLITPDGH